MANKIQLPKGVTAEDILGVLGGPMRKVWTYIEPCLNGEIEWMEGDERKVLTYLSQFQSSEDAVINLGERALVKTASELETLLLAIRSAGQPVQVLSTARTKSLDAEKKYVYSAHEDKLVRLGYVKESFDLPGVTGSSAMGNSYGENFLNGTLFRSVGTNGTFGADVKSVMMDNFGYPDGGTAGRSSLAVRVDYLVKNSKAPVTLPTHTFLLGYIPSGHWDLYPQEVDETAVPQGLIYAGVREESWHLNPQDGQVEQDFEAAQQIVLDKYRENFAKLYEKQVADTCQLGIVEHETTRTLTDQFLSLMLVDSIRDRKVDVRRTELVIPLFGNTNTEVYHLSCPAKYKGLVIGKRAANIKKITEKVRKKINPNLKKIVII